MTKGGALAGSGGCSPWRTSAPPANGVPDTKSAGTTNVLDEG
ncbi:hypothetical protein SAMN04489765_3799 [Tsukamurella pulmonis]|uniref:Uncharacterized protein n=1 Tax=Tsukamurella pulmonis TaxID=47312 RepID=A0A1H1H529_9ACTN|nr:hypothetical protein [Tsukamurella pulmonis]SDR20186.1 hypothetical protein SAMN04489765_3799 [Tsukamurella pulmonis]SUP16001.1 Uncharacterised protein [Tsukamurella pulmonis]